MAELMQRYEIGDKVCGIIAYAENWQEAQGRAALYAAGNSHKGCPVTIFDRMAHRGRPQLWQHDGRCIGRREA